MGSENGEDDEQPVHNVTLDAFWMDRVPRSPTPCTHAAWRLANSSPPSFSSSRSRNSYYGEVAYADYPVVWVTWNKALAYCEGGVNCLQKRGGNMLLAVGWKGQLIPWGGRSSELCIGGREWGSIRPMFYK